MKLLNINKSTLIIAIGLTIINISGCNKLLEVSPPPTSMNAANVYANDATAIAVLTGIYSNMSTSNIFSGGLTSVSLLTGLSSDELTLYSGITNSGINFYYTNALTSSNLGSNDFWFKIYPIIYVTNSAIEGLNNSNTLTPVVKKQLIGEAKFVRAFCYFYLVNLYGDVPLAISTDYKINSSLSRSPKAEVYQQIIKDLKDAQSLLSSNYSDATLLKESNERIRPTKWSATALLARAYLFTGDFANAEAQASEVINTSSLFTLSPLNDVFLKNSSEAIWELQPTLFGRNTEDGWIFIIPNTGPSDSWPVYLNENLLNSFELGDQRRSGWVDSVIASGVTYHYSHKYKSATLNDPVIEYLMVLRLGEQYLIRAEARAQQNNISGALGDLNIIRHRAGLADYSGVTSQASVLSTILHERQVELFTEWGHRWLDLKRTGKIDQVLSVITPLKGGSWNTNKQLYPIPSYELEKDHNLIQNAGY